jgi:histone deacetylase complex regulatory component SIN3
MIDRKVEEPREIVEYLVRLVKVLQENFLQTLTQVTNIQLSLANTGVYYFDLPDDNGVYADNSWRLIKVDDAIQLQKRVTGSWEKVAKWDY